MNRNKPCVFQLTRSLRSEARVGSVVILSRAASLRALSRPDWSTSRNLSTSLGVGSMGTHSVASSTRDAILSCRCVIEGISAYMYTQRHMYIHMSVCI